MKFKTVLIILLVFASCKNEEKKAEIATNDNVVEKQIEANLDLEVYDFAGFEKFLNRDDGKIHVINFWATWCAPCVKELPYFEKLNAEYGNENVEVLLVSLDFPHLYESKLKPFIKDNKLKSKVIALDDADMNTWIPKVDETWSGSLPATIIYKNNKRKFFEQSFTFEALETEVKQFLK
ncbi:AhpC/TSA family protein [Mariniflexile fucanivorans]|uniref:AhpC/TSA family protein n=1 Tax=Mariniflexile fucanivorans TaxID=264023 RepID=A0A4R1RKJ6_9FLAO|nr:TlpA disulfide reductase family protein [Mariniflexile fucanivorans]TCL66721.1 AhpC/TSA family protein [Mariniflexile fucanivorans]